MRWWLTEVRLKPDTTYRLGPAEAGHHVRSGERPEADAIVANDPAIGAAVMSLWLAFHPPMTRAGRTLLWSVAGFGVATIVFGLSTWFPVSLLALFVLLVVRRLVLGAEVEGVFTLFAIAFFLIGILLAGVGLLGEYIGRIYEEVRARPKFIVDRAEGFARRG